MRRVGTVAIVLLSVGILASPVQAGRRGECELECDAGADVGRFMSGLCTPNKLQLNYLATAIRDLEEAVVCDPELVCDPSVTCLPAPCTCPAPPAPVSVRLLDLAGDIANRCGPRRCKIRARGRQLRISCRRCVELDTEAPAP